ncbi:MAG: hypothetical protein AVDCRST_MAG10-31, partial [uncultured Acidimicrobiales bacterium]
CRRAKSAASITRRSIRLTLRPPSGPSPSATAPPSPASCATRTVKCSCGSGPRRRCGRPWSTRLTSVTCSSRTTAGSARSWTRTGRCSRDRAPTTWPPSGGTTRTIRWLSPTHWPRIPSAWPPPWRRCRPRAGTAWGCAGTRSGPSGYTPAAPCTRAVTTCSTSVAAYGPCVTSARQPP